MRGGLGEKVCQTSRSGHNLQGVVFQTADSSNVILPVIGSADAMVAQKVHGCKGTSVEIRDFRFGPSVGIPCRSALGPSVEIRYIKVSMRSSPHRATTHRGVAFYGSNLSIKIKNPEQLMLFWFAHQRFLHSKVRVSRFVTLWYRFRPARNEQHPTGVLHLMVRISPHKRKNQKPHK